MSINTKVHFVCFETTLSKEPFIKRWKQYSRSSNSDSDVTLQEFEKDGLFFYIAQHRFENSEWKFIFKKEGRSSRIAQERIKTTHAGGYSILSTEKVHKIATGESKVFVFLKGNQDDLAPYKELALGQKLNIYEAFFQNCQHDYILEYFVKNKDTPGLLEQLKPYETSEPGIYKECIIAKNQTKKEIKDDYSWAKN